MVTEGAGLHMPLSPAWADGTRCSEWLTACHHACLD